MSSVPIVENVPAHGGGVSLGLGASHFKCIASQGLGDPLNGYFQSAAWFGGRYYVGTTRANMVLVHEAWEKSGRKHALAQWPVRTPASVYDVDLRAQVWCYDPVDARWTKVFTSPMVPSEAGFEVPMSIGFRTMTVFQGSNDPAPALYVPTWATSDWPTSVMLRSYDGKRFDVCSEPGLGFGDPMPRCLRGLVPFRGRLFTAPAMGQIKGQPQMAGQSIIFCAEDPGGQWKRACAPGFNDSNNISIYEMGVFKDRLYAGTLNPVEGYQVWRTDGEGEPPFRWTRVLSHGAYRGNLNEGAMTLSPFRDHLYVGSAIQFGGYDRDFKIGPAPPEVVRIAEDDSWEIVCGDPRLTPDGLKVPISGMGPAFGNFCACYLWCIQEHDGWLYSGDAVWSPFLNFTERSTWSSTLRFLVEQFVPKYGGVNLWRSRDGSTWEPVTQTGFNNELNLGVRTMHSTPHGLFVSMGNPFGPEVAVQRAAGWTFEQGTGGAQVWLGSEAHAVPVAPAYELGGDGGISGFVVPASAERLIEEFYGGSGYRHAGSWTRRTLNAAEACENLMGEVLACLPEKRGTVLDIGCGLGATTAYLLRYFAPEDLTGLCEDKAAVRACEGRAPGVRFLHGTLGSLPVGMQAYDVALAIESPARAGGREKFFAEVRRVLKPGGRVVVTDILRTHRKNGRVHTEPENAEAYRLLLEKCGYNEVRVFDLTASATRPFGREVTRHFQAKVLLNEISVERYEEVRGALPGAGADVACYLAVTAVRG